MKRLLLLAAITGLTAFAQLQEAKNVYIMPMAGGLDQHLALLLTQDHVLQVVTDPEKADVLFTDRIGTGFEAALKELYPPPTEPVKEEAKDQQANAFPAYKPPAMKPLSRSRGAVFLIDRKSRDVLWSTFEEPKSTDPQDLYKAAKEVVTRLAKDMKKSDSHD